MAYVGVRKANVPPWTIGSLNVFHSINVFNLNDYGVCVCKTDNVE